MLSLVDLRTYPQMKTNLRFNVFGTVDELAYEISRIFRIPPSKLRLFINNIELSKSNVPVIDYINTNSESVSPLSLKRASSSSAASSSNSPTIVYYTLKNASKRNNISPLIRGNKGDLPSPLLLSLIHSISQGFDIGYVPKLTLDGSGGTYFLASPAHKRHYIGVFKPSSQEPFCEDNPRGLVSTNDDVEMRAGVSPGSSAVREVAAFLIDASSIVKANVPPTCMVEVTHDLFKESNNNIGSLQVYKRNDGVSSDVASCKFIKSQVWSIALLDMRILNLDRHDANLLIKRRKDSLYDLIPIDHGYCLPTGRINIGWCDWCWWDWPYIREDLQDDFINNAISGFCDNNTTLQSLLLSPKALWNMKIVETTLLVGLKKRRNLYVLSRFIAREDLDIISGLEECIAEVNDQMKKSTNRKKIEQIDEISSVAVSPSVSKFWKRDIYKLEKESSSFELSFDNNDCDDYDENNMFFFSQEDRYFKLLESVVENRI